MLDLLLERAKASDLKFFRGCAIPAAVNANIHRDPEKRPDGFSEFDFVPAYLVPAELKVGHKFDRAGNVGRTNVKKMTAAERQDFFLQMFGCGVKPDGTVVKEPENKRILVKM